LFAEHLESNMPRRTFSAIRQLAATYDGPRIAAAEFECTVQIWDLRTRKRFSVFETLLDFGGTRLAISPRGDTCAAAAYRPGGLACYATDSGDVVYARNDLKKLQRLVYSPDGKLLYCGGAEGPLRILDAATGTDLARYRSTDKVFCSSHQPIELLTKRRRPLELRRVGGKRIATIARMGFAVHDIAFGTDRVCVSEAGGGNPFRSDNAPPLLRCLDTRSGSELWRYAPRQDCNIPCLAYAPKAMAFFGVEYQFKAGGDKRLLRFELALGKPTLVARMKKPCATQVFCARGEALLTSEGELIDVFEGISKRVFRFPSDKASP
jgi:hypothetical protein